MGERYISDEDVRLIKEYLWMGKGSTGWIADQFVISQPYVSMIKTGRVYAHIPWPDGTTGKMSPTRVRELRISAKVTGPGAGHTRAKGWGPTFNGYANGSINTIPPGYEPLTQIDPSTLEGEELEAWEKNEEENKRFGELAVAEAKRIMAEREQEEQRAHAEAMERFRREQAEYEKTRTDDPKPIKTLYDPSDIFDFVIWERIMRDNPEHPLVLSAEEGNDLRMKAALCRISLADAGGQVVGTDFASLDNTLLTALVNNTLKQFITDDSD